MEYILSILWIAIEFLAFHYFWSAFLERKVGAKRYWITFLLIWIFDVALMQTGMDALSNVIVSTALAITVCAMNFKGSVPRKILLVIAAYIFGAILDTLFLYGASAITGASPYEFALRIRSYIIIVTAGKLFALLTAWVVCRFFKKHKTGTIHKNWLIMTILFPLTSFSMVMIVFWTGYRESDISWGVVVLCGIVVVANVAILYLIHTMEKHTTEAKELALLHQQMALQTESIVALERSYRTQRQSTHEFKHQLQTIYDLIGREEYKEAESYIANLQDIQTSRIFRVNTRHPIIDAVLNNKVQLAEEDNIDFQMKVNDLSSVKISTDKLVVVLSNLIDNAIEACRRYDGTPMITLSLLLDESLFLSIQNTSVPVVIQNKQIATTKTPKEEHGYGLPHVMSILDGLKAEYSMKYADGHFVFVAEIPLEE